MRKDFSVKTIVAIGIGSAVFVILGRFGVIPTGFPNTNIETAYPFLSLMAVIFGPIAGALIGLIGHTLKDFMTHGSAWWSWVLGSGVIGFIYGLAGRTMTIQQGELTKKNILTFNLFQVVGHILVWGLLAPTLDLLIYSEPANKVFIQGIIAVITNSLAVGILGTLLLKMYAATRVKKGSLSKE